MPYDENLASRITQSLKGKRGITQKKMFGGLCFLLHGNMVCGVVKNRLCARVGPEGYEKALKSKFATEMDFTGKPLKGMVYVLPEGLRTKAMLDKWVKVSFDFARTLPKKKRK